jgi:hypothetical protein
MEQTLGTKTSIPSGGGRLALTIEGCADCDFLSPVPTESRDEALPSKGHVPSGGALISCC